MSTMDIHSKKGTKIKFANPEAGYRPIIEKAKRHLTVGKKYTVSYTVVHNGHTDVYLVEAPGVRFNSSMFDRIGRRTS